VFKDLSEILLRLYPSLTPNPSDIVGYWVPKDTSVVAHQRTNATRLFVLSISSNHRSYPYPKCRLSILNNANLLLGDLNEANLAAASDEWFAGWFFGEQILFWFTERVVVLVCTLRCVLPGLSVNACVCDVNDLGAGVRAPWSEGPLPHVKFGQVDFTRIPGLNFQQEDKSA
jgi:hypothetical protein